MHDLPAFFQGTVLQSWTFPEIFEIFDFSQKTKCYSFRKIYFLKDFLWKKHLAFFLKIEKFSKKVRTLFQIDITSSDLNEFWIWQKFWRGESLLFDLSTTFMGVLSREKKREPSWDNFFFHWAVWISPYPGGSYVHSYFFIAPQANFFAILRCNCVDLSRLLWFEGYICRFVVQKAYTFTVKAP